MKPLSLKQYYAITGLCLAVVFYYLEIVTTDIFPRAILRPLAALADASLLLIPLLFLRGRYRIITVLVPPVLYVLIFANVIYYRNFNDLIPVSMYGLGQLSDPIILNSCVNSLKATDFIPLVFAFVPAILLIIYRRTILGPATLGVKYKLIAAGFCVACWGITEVASVRRYLHYGWATSIPDALDSLFPPHNLAWINDYCNHNFTGYAIRCLICIKGMYLPISEADIAAIKERFTQKAVDKATSDSKQHPDNMVMIVVESLPGVALEKEEYRRFAPTLITLMVDTTTLYTTHCKVLTAYGRSADAHFMYLTGLLPLRNEALVMRYCANDYPSVTKALKLPSVEIIGEDKSLWSHGITNRSYGFDGLIDNIADDCLDQDSIIFATAAKRAIDEKTNFFHFITSISMHDPYTWKAVTHYPAELSDSIPDKDKEYLARLHHFDTALGAYIAKLKEHNIYDNTAIIIVGDHEIRASEVSDGLHDDRVPVIILNSGIKALAREEATQIDVFPTILDIMGVDYTYMGVPYRGLGRSLLLPQGAEPTAQDYEISEKIIRRKPAKN